MGAGPLTTLRWGRVAVLVFTAVVVQAGVLDTVRPLGLRIDLPLLLVVGVSLVAGRRDAAVVGWATGLLVDLHQLLPLGLSALVYAVLAWTLAGGRRSGRDAGRWWRTLQGAIAMAGVQVVLVLGSALVGHGPGRSVWSVAAAVLGSALVGAIGVHPATACGRRLVRTSGVRFGSPLSRSRPA